MILEGLMEGYYREMGDDRGYGIFGTISKWVEIGPITANVLPVDRSKLISGD